MLHRQFVTVVIKRGPRCGSAGLKVLLKLTTYEDKKAELLQR